MEGPSLVRLDVGGTQEPIRLDRSPFLVGRGGGSAIRIDSPKVSTKHARFVLKDGNPFLEDLKSRNGTRVNGVRISGSYLAEGDLVEIEPAGFLFSRGLPEGAFLFTLVGPPQGKSPREYPLVGRPLRAGRHGKSDLVLTDPESSARHFELLPQGEAYEVVDLGSTNGTFVNGKRVERSPLAHGDEVTVGASRFLFHSPHEATPPRLGGGRFTLALFTAGREFRTPLEGDTASIGSGAGDSFCLPPHPEVGAGKVQLTRVGRLWIARDAGGPGALYVGGKKTEEHVLAHGDELAIGPYRVVFQNDALPAETFLLTFLGGERGGEEVVLGEESLALGRHPTNQVRLDCPGVSTHHARIDFESGRFRIQDLGSTNGTLVNGTKLTGAHLLEHGDRIEVGGQTLVFRSSGRERPEELARERFVLLAERGKGETFPVRGPSFAIGRDPSSDLVLDSPRASAHHALVTEKDGRFLVRDLDSTNGTFVNRSRVKNEVKLSHGDVIRFGKARFVFKNELLPLARRPTLPLAPLAASGGLVTALVVALAMFFSSTSTPPSGDEEEGTQEADLGEESRESAAPSPGLSSLQSLFATAKADAERHWPERAVPRLVCLMGREDLGDLRGEAEALLARCRILARPLSEFRRRVSEEAREFAPWVESPQGRSRIVGWDDSSLVIETEDGTRQVGWHEFSPHEMLDHLVARRLEEIFPLEVAQYALSVGDEVRGRRFLALYLSRHPERKERVDRGYGASSRLPLPEGGWLLRGDRLVTREEASLAEAREAALREASEARLREEAERARQELEAREALEATRRLVEEESDAYLGTISSYVLSHRYKQALEALEAYLARVRALEMAELATRVEDRLFDVRGQALLFSRLLDSVNDQRLARRPRWQTASGSHEVELAHATEEEVELLLPTGSLRLRWRFAHPEDLLEFYSCLPSFTTQERYFLGHYALSHGQDDAARFQWVTVLKSGAKDLASRISRSLALCRGIPIPGGGFVVHENQIVTPEEKAQLQKGLVLFRGEWVARADRDRLQAGLVEYRGNWVTRERHKALLALEDAESYRAQNEGFYRENGEWVYRFQKVVDGELYLSVGGKYLPAKEARAARSEWANAWRLSTDHYDLVTNMDDDFLIEWADFMEEAWKAYVAYFGKEIEKRLELFAFRTYEDYRRYCEDTNNEAQLQAAGFADSSTNRGVGWDAGKSKSTFFETLIHEGAHLYYFNVFPSHFVPSWYAEGTATQFEGIRWDKEKGTLTMDAVSRSRLATLKSQILAGTAMKIPDILRGDAHRSIQSGPAAGTTFYASAWGLMYFLDHSEDLRIRGFATKYKEKMDGGHYGYYGGSGTPAPGQEPFEQLYGAEGIDELQRLWEEFIRKLP